MKLTTEKAIEALNDMLAFEIDEFGGVPQPIAEEAVYMAINALRGEEPPGEWVQVHDNVWECPKCGNRDQSKMNVARRTCGYIGSQFWNQGRTQEIKERVLHL